MSADPSTERFELAIQVLPEDIDLFDHVNSEHNFCIRCGRLLHPACPRCQFAVLVEDDFCGRCGLALTPRAQFEWTSNRQRTGISSRAIPSIDEFVPKGFAAKLDAARSSGAMVGERRIVTMLFCDVKGSIAAAERLDPIS